MRLRDEDGATSRSGDPRGTRAGKRLDRRVNERDLRDPPGSLAGMLEARADEHQLHA